MGVLTSKLTELFFCPDSCAKRIYVVSCLHSAWLVLNMQAPCCCTV